MPGDREGNAAPRKPASRSVDLVEPLEDAGEVTGRNPRASVPYGNLNPVVVGTRSNDHLPRRGELEGIVDDVLQRLVRLGAVTERRETNRRNLGTQDEPASSRPRLVPIDERAHQVINGERVPFTAETAGIAGRELIKFEQNVAKALRLLGDSVDEEPRFAAGRKLS